MKLSVEYTKAAQVVAGRPDVVLIHGTGSSAKMWQPQIEFLSNLGHSCHSLNLRGHGDTSDPLEITDLAVHTADVLETIANSEIKFPAVFLGHSLGAIISVTLAENNPELVAAVFAAGLPGRVLKPVSFFFRIFMGTTFDVIKKSNIHQNWGFRPRTLINTERHALEQIMYNFKDLDYVTNLPRIQCPIHLAAGRFDPVAPCIYSVQMHKKLPDSTLTIFEIAGHNFMDTQPRKFNQWLESGLDSLQKQLMS